MVGTDEPRWPRNRAGPRALVECDDPAVQDGLVRALREEGYDVAACAGPHARGSGVCPLVERGECGLVADADVVVHVLDGADERHRAVLAAVRDSANTPVVVEVTTAGGDDVAFAGCQRVPYPITRTTLLAAVDRALGREGLPADDPV